VRVFKHAVAGVVRRVHVPERDEDLDEFWRFMAQGDKYLAVDTESTGLDLFHADHKLRLVQIGNTTDAWVLRFDLFPDVVRQALLQERTWIAHNAPFDALTLDRHAGVPLAVFLPRCWDTKILAHLQDPRGKEEGGIGLGLKEQCAKHVDPTAPDTSNGLTKVFNAFGWTKHTGWARISADHSLYLLYAGLDVILCSMLFEKLHRVALNMAELCKFEHRLQFLVTLMQKRGMLIDVPYVHRLIIDLHNEHIDQVDIAFDLGVDNIYSNTQVLARLQEMGETLTERTEKGQLKCDIAVLAPMADLDRQWQHIGSREPNALAEAVLRAKRAKKWSTAYAEAFLDGRDSSDRLHPRINSLQARTARMSIDSPALQQLPSGDWRIRRCFIPDPGYVMIAADYQAVEMRVLAALCGDWTMKDAIKRGLDLHSFTAASVAGIELEKFLKLLKDEDKGALRQRKVAKAIGFGKVYGGGAATISRQTGTDEDAVREALKAYDRTFPGIRRYSTQLVNTAKAGCMEVITPIGRRLPLDEDRLYAATNYMVQSTARDLLAKAVVKVFEAGLGDYIMLPVHDELLGQAPEQDAYDIIHEIGRIMETTFQGVAITTEAKVVGPSWGAAYKAPAVLPDEMPVRKERKLRDGEWAQESLDLGV
jgi:DNA polymerase I